MSRIKGRSHSHKEIHELPGERAGKMGVERKRRWGETAARVKTLYVLSYSGARLTRLEVAGNRGHGVAPICLCPSRGAGLRRIFVSLVTRVLRGMHTLKNLCLLHLSVP